MTLIRNESVCTFCLTVQRNVSDGMCKKCDDESIIVERAFVAAQRYTKKPCRLCHQPLPTSRYFHCEACEPAVFRDTDDPDFIYASFEENWSEPKPLPEILMTGVKTCACCKREKSRIEFYRNPTNIGDSHRSYCKLCCKAKERQAKIKKAELEASRLQENGARHV